MAKLETINGTEHREIDNVMEVFMTAVMLALKERKTLHGDVSTEFAENVIQRTAEILQALVAGKYVDDKGGILTFIDSLPEEGELTI